MTETRCLKNVVIFFQIILSFVLSRKINYKYISFSSDFSTDVEHLFGFWVYMFNIFTIRFFKWYSKIL